MREKTRKRPRHLQVVAPSSEAAKAPRGLQRDAGGELSRGIAVAEVTLGVLEGRIFSDATDQAGVNRQIS